MYVNLQCIERSPGVPDRPNRLLDYLITFFHIVYPGDIPHFGLRLCIIHMEYVKSFKDLEFYKLSRRLAKEIFDASKKLPKDERYSLTEQIRRSSRSVGAQIAEAWAKRKYERHL
jgi:hypothetical protein